MLEGAVVRDTTPSRIQLELDFELQLRPALPEYYQDNDQHQNDHSITPFHSIVLRTSLFTARFCVEYRFSLADCASQNEAESSA